MKQRIFISIHYLEIGGAEISLIGLLNAIDYSRYEVDLFVYSHRGELMRWIPKQVRLLPEIRKYAQIEEPMWNVLKRGYWDMVVARLWAKYNFSKYAKKNRLKEGSAVFQYVFNAVTPLLPSLYQDGEYDLAISFLTPHNVVADKVNAKKKVAWIHTDYTKVSVNVEKELPVWSRFDYVVSISPDVTHTFLSVFPSLRDKIVEIANILSPLFVRQRADEQVDLSLMEQGSMKILSVGRYSYPKNFDNVPDILRRIRLKGIDASWFLIGYGGDEGLIRQKIEEAGMQKWVHLLGKQENPYPYIKACDIYVQPSRFEGNSVTVREAQMLCKPVVVTNYPTAHSQVKDGLDGIIVPMENEKCAEGIVKFVQDKDLQSSLISYLHSHDYGNEREVEKVYKLV